MEELLKDHLNKEASLYKELIAALQKETENLVARDYKALYETVASKEHVTSRIEMIGRARAHIFSKAASALGLKGDINLTAIIENFSSPAKDELKELQATLLSLIESVKEINQVNSLAVRGSLENITKTLGFLGNFLPGSTYKRGGTLEAMSVKGARLNEGA